MAISNLLQPPKFSTLTANNGGPLGQMQQNNARIAQIGTNRPMQINTQSGKLGALSAPAKQSVQTAGTSGLATTNFGIQNQNNSGGTNLNTTGTQPLVQQTIPQPQPTPQPQGLFPSVVSSLANRGTTPNQTAQDYTAQSAVYGAGSIPIAAQARDIAQQFGQKYAEIGQEGAKFQAGQLTTGTSPVAEGNAAVTARTVAAQQTALAQGQQAALQGVGYQLTGQQQAQAGANAAAGQAYTGQGLQQAALGTAASYTQPSQNFPYVFDPLTGTYKAPGVGGGTNAGGGLTYNPTTDAQTFAQQVINHQIPYQDALNALGYAGPAATALLQQAIVQGGGNLTQLQAQTGIQTAQEQQVQGYKSALQQGQNLQTQLKDLITTFGLNPNDLNVSNIALQKIATNTSDPHYQQLANYINEVANTYSQILTPPGGTSTDTTRAIATSMLDATANGSSLIDTMKQLDNAAQAKIAGVQTITPSTGGSNSGISGATIKTSAGDVNPNF